MVWYKTFPSVLRSGYTPSDYFLFQGPGIYFHLNLAFKELGLIRPQVFTEHTMTGRMF